MRKRKGEGLPKVTQPVLPSYSGLSVQRKGAAPNGYGLVKKVLRKVVGYDNSASGGSGGSSWGDRHGWVPAQGMGQCQETSVLRLPSRTSAGPSTCSAGLKPPAALTLAPRKGAKARTGIPQTQAAVVTRPGNPKAHALTGGPSLTGAARQASRKGQARGGPQSLASVVYS